jgi:hypothetical protein
LQWRSERWRRMLDLLRLVGLVGQILVDDLKVGLRLLGV